MPALTLAPAAFLAGVLMFLAPCTLPIVPGYLAFIAGPRGRVMQNAFAFVVGFSIIFIILGTFAGAIGALLFPWRGMLTRVAGVLIILFGLMLLEVIRIPALTQERRISLPGFLIVGRMESSLLIGILFALGWSPCIGPILGTVLLLASGSSTALQGALLLGVFSLGLALPFLLSAMLIKEAEKKFARAGNSLNVLSKIGGGILVAIGVLMLLGDMGILVSWGLSVFNFLGYNRLLQYL